MFICLVIAVAVIVSANADQMQNLRSFKQPADVAKIFNPKFNTLVPLGASVASSQHSVDAMVVGKPKKLATSDVISARELGSWSDKLHESVDVKPQAVNAPVITGVASGWAYSNYWASCSAADTANSPSVVGGSVIGLCTPSQAITGNSVNKFVYFDSCTPNSIMRYVYNSSDCAASSYYYSESVPLGVCQTDTERNLGYKFQCTTASTDLPVSGEYVTVATSFDSNINTQCQAVSDQFTAYQWNVCIKGNKGSGHGGFGSLKFGCSNPANNNPATVTARTYNDASCKDFNHPITNAVGCTNQNSGSVTTYQDFQCYASAGQELAYDDQFDFDDTQSDDAYVFPTEGYFVYDYFNGKQCSDTHSFSVGYALNSCLVGYDENDVAIGSIQGTCSATDGQFKYKTFQSIDCTGSHTNANATISGGNCFATKNGNPWGESASVRCAFGSELPVNFDSVVVTGYAGSSSSTCNSNVTMFLAYGENNAETCFPTGTATGFAQSYQLQCFGDESTFNVLEYPQSGTCSNNYKIASYPTGCFSTQSESYQSVNSFLNLEYWSSKLFDSSDSVSMIELEPSAPARELSQVSAPTAGQTYLVENYHKDVEDCNTTNPELNFVTASQGYAVGVCINQHNNTGITGSFKILCPSSDPNVAQYFEWDTPNCVGAYNSNTANLTLNQCQNSLGTSYSAYSLTCPVVPDFNDGFVYQLKYDNSDSCNSAVIEYNSAQPFTCISTDLQTSQIYSCYSDTEIQMMTFSDPQCSTSTGSTYYQETCTALKNPTNQEIYGYYTRPYCSSGNSFTSYFIRYYYDEATSCDANNQGVPPANAVASQGWAANTCIVNHDNNGATTSFMYTCSGSGSAALVTYNTPDCSGTGTSVSYTLDTCSNSVGTSYGAYSYSCNANEVPLDNGQIYQLKYDANSNQCRDGPNPFIEFSAVNPDLCVSTNSQTASKYYCDAGESVTVQSYAAADCTSVFTSQVFPATCNAIANPNNNVISGYYTVPYCLGGDDYHPFVPSYPGNQTTLYEYVKVSCHSGNAPNDDSKSSSSGTSLSGGAIAGIAIAGAVVFIGVGYFVYSKMKAGSSSDLNKALVADQNSQVAKTDMYSSNENPILKQTNQSFDKNNKF